MILVRSPHPFNLLLQVKFSSGWVSLHFCRFLHSPESVVCEFSFQPLCFDCRKIFSHHFPPLLTPVMIVQSWRVSTPVCAAPPQAPLFPFIQSSEAFLIIFLCPIFYFSKSWLCDLLFLPFFRLKCLRGRASTFLSPLFFRLVSPFFFSEIIARERFGALLFFRSLPITIGNLLVLPASPRSI